MGALGSEFMSDMESVAAATERDLLAITAKNKKQAMRSLRQQPPQQRYYNALVNITDDVIMSVSMFVRGTIMLVAACWLLVAGPSGAVCIVV